MIRNIESFVRRLGRDQSGTVAIYVAITFAVLLGFGALVVDVGSILYAQRELQSTADVAAMAGAQDINCCTPSTAIATATAYSAVSGATPPNKNALSNLTVTMAAGYPKMVCITSTGITCGGSDPG